MFHHSGTKTYAGRILGTGTLAREGSGTTILTGNVTPEKGTSVRAGTLQIGTGGASGTISGTLDLAAGLVVDRSGTLVHSDSLRGSGNLFKRGAGTLVLAGANSSGKSSAMQPLLLLKQTLASPVDPGVLNIAGPNVQFTQYDPPFSNVPATRRARISASTPSTRWAP